LARTRAAVDVLQGATAPSGPRLDVAVDEEGGAVLTLRGPGIDSVPSARRQGQQSPASLSRATARWSAQLHDAGITLNLAPVADTVTAADKGRNPPIGAFDREYGGSPDDVANRVATVVSAMDSAGLGSTLKHFPGLGRVRHNTDVSTGALDGRATMTDANLRPFAAGIAAGATAVMVSSARYPQMDHVNIATFSRPIVTGLLRERMGFHGLVLSDDLGSAVAVRALPVGLRAALFIAAGGDIALTVRPADAPLMTAELSRRARVSSAFRTLVDAAALRVLRSKASRHLLPCG
ncbi:MAG: glycoside hydrolase family 3 protein, partial [Actinomycetota bacterium]|nr:glycoside hydrolase family 3 protein [Actinomycetota bacterium]